MNVYTVITIATAANSDNNALDVSKVAYRTRDAAVARLADYEETRPNLFTRTAEDGTTFTVLVAEHTVEDGSNG